MGALQFKPAKTATVKLEAKYRGTVERAIRETCEIRKWALFALNARTNHVHVVVANPGKKPELMLNASRLTQPECCARENYGI